MSDSIAGTVTAILCVVVGLLIIGTALVPIVENASQTETTETVTGENSLNTNSSMPFVIPFSQIDGEITFTSADGVPDVSIYANGSDFSDLSNSVVETASNNITYMQDHSNWNAFTITSQGIVFSGLLGDTSADPLTVDGDFIIYVTDISELTPYFQQDLIYGLTSAGTSVIGDSQCALKMNGKEFVPFKASEAPSGITATENDNGSFTLSGNQYAYLAPLGWTQDVTTTETSEYAPLYAIIPIMLILSMAYVLIRRF